MNTLRRAVVAAELLLIFPASLFMAALGVRDLQLHQYEQAGSAQRIVMWYATRQWTLWVLLLALPFAVLVTGFAMLRKWSREGPHGERRLHPTTLIVAATTLTAGVVLLIVGLHMLMN